MYSSARLTAGLALAAELDGSWPLARPGARADGAFQRHTIRMHMRTISSTCTWACTCVRAPLAHPHAQALLALGVCCRLPSPQIRGHANPVRSIDLSSSLMVSGAEKGGLRFWSLSDVEVTCVRQLICLARTPPTRVCLRPPLTAADPAADLPRREGLPLLRRL